MFLVHACVNLSVLWAFTLPFDPLTDSTGAFIEFKSILQNNCHFLFHPHPCLNLSFTISKYEEHISENEQPQVKTDND